jgi:hypothetical protein
MDKRNSGASTNRSLDPTPISPTHRPSSSRNNTINDPTVVLRFQENPFVRRGSMGTSINQNNTPQDGSGRQSSNTSERKRRHKSGTLELMTTLHSPAPRTNRNPPTTSPPSTMGSSSGTRSNDSGNYPSNYSTSSSSSSSASSSGVRRGIWRRSGQPQNSTDSGRGLGRYPPDDSEELSSIYEVPRNRSLHGECCINNTQLLASFPLSSLSLRLDKILIWI